MPNIFENKSESDLVGNRDVKPIKGYQPLGEPTPRKPEPEQTERVPEQPELQNPAHPNMILPNGLQKPSIPVAPPIGYGRINGGQVANTGNAEDLINLEVQKRQGLVRDEAVGQFLNGGISTEPVQRTSPFNSEIEAQGIRDEWKKYVIPPTVGLSPSTSFGEDGNLERKVPPEDVSVGTHGLQSELGNRLENELDKQGFWSSNLQRIVAFFGYGKNVLDYLTVQQIENLPLSPSGIGSKLGEMLFGGNEEIMKRREEEIKEIESEFIGLTLPDLYGTERSEGYKLRPKLPEIGDYGSAGILSLGTFLLNLAPNLASGLTYEYADAYIDSKVEKPNASPLVTIFDTVVKGTSDVVIGTGREILKESVQGAKPEGDTRIVSVLKGKNISISERWSDENYLGIQEPEDLPLGQTTGNWWWDLPENVHDYLLTEFNIKSDLRGLHWATQGALAGIVDLSLDVPFDMGLDKLKSLRGISKLDDVSRTGRVVSDVPFGTSPKLPDVKLELATPNTGILRQPNVQQLTPRNNQYLLPSPNKGGVVSELNIISPDLGDVTKLDVNPNPRVLKEINDTGLVVKVDAEDFVPSINRGQALIIQLDEPQMNRTLFGDLPVTERSLDDLSVQGSLLVDESGLPLFGKTHKITEAEATVLMDYFPDEFSRFGKTVNPNLPYANVVRVEIPKTSLSDLQDVQVLQADKSFLSLESRKNYDLDLTTHDWNTQATGDIVRVLDKNMYSSERLTEMYDNLSRSSVDLNGDLEGQRVIKRLLEERPSNSREVKRLYYEETGRNLNDDVVRVNDIVFDNTEDFTVVGDTDELPPNPHRTFAPLNKSVPPDETPDWKNKSLIRVGKSYSEYDAHGNRIFPYPTRARYRRAKQEIDEWLISVGYPDPSDTTRPSADSLSDLNKQLSDKYGFEVAFAPNFSLKEIRDRVVNIEMNKDGFIDIMRRNGTVAYIEGHGTEYQGGTFRLGSDKPWQEIIDNKYPEGTRVMVVSCSGESCGVASGNRLDSWQVFTSGGLQKKTYRDVPIERSEWDNPLLNEPKPSNVESLLEGTEKFKSNIRKGVFNNRELRELRLQEARIPSDEYYRKLAKLPDYLKGNLPDTVKTGSEYIDTLRKVEYHGVNLKYLDIQVDDLEAVSRKIKSRMDTIGRVEMGNINSELGTQAANGFNPEYLKTPKSKVDLPPVKPQQDVIEELSSIQPRVPVIKRLPDNVAWKHGTRHKTDIRSYIPENGSGTHELGMGVYFTTDDDLARSAALAYGHGNVPASLADAYGEPVVRSVDVTRMRNVLDMNSKTTKRQFGDLYSKAFTDAGGTPREFTSFWRYHQKHGGRYADVFDNYRLWYYEVNKSPISELQVRDFQTEVLKELKRQGVDGGIFTGSNGKQTLIVYNPEKLVNMDVVPVQMKGNDLVAESLEARRYVDNEAFLSHPDEYTDYSRLRSTQEVTEFIKQSYGEAYAKVYFEQSEEIDKLIKLREELARKVELEKASKESVETVEEVTERGFETSTQSLSEIYKKDERYRKHRSKVDARLRSLEKQLTSKHLSNKQRELIEAKITELVKRGNEIDERILNLQRTIQAVNPKSKIPSNQLEGLRQALKTIQNQTHNPKWVRKSGNYARRSSLERLRERIQRFMGENFDSMLGGKFGDAQERLVEARRAFRGQLAFELMKTETDKIVSTVYDTVRTKLRKYGLDQNQLAEIMSGLAELQASPYLLEGTDFANSNVAKVLASLKREKMLKFHKEYGIPIDVLVDVAEEVRKIPEVYQEVYKIVTDLGMSVGDEVTLGYIPRLKTRSAQYTLRSKGLEESVKKSRKAFDYVVEDSWLVDDFLQGTRFYDKASEMTGRTIKSVEDVIGENGLLEYAFIEMLSDEKLDALLKMGILNKVPFTSDRVAKYLIDKFELPFSGLNDVFISDPRRAFEVYKRRLEDSIVKMGMVYDIGDDSAWSISKEMLEDLGDTSKYDGWVELESLIPDSVSSKMNRDIWNSMRTNKVHPVIGELVSTHVKLQTSPFQLGVIGNIINSLTRYLQGTMLATVQFATNNILGNSGSLLVRGINPAGSYTRWVYTNMRGKFDKLPTIKMFGGGKYSVKDLYEEAVRRGIIDSDTMFGRGRPLVYKGQAKDAALNSFAEFANFAKLGGKDNYIVGMVDRFLDGAASFQDHTIFKYINWVNNITDNSYKMSLLEAVMLDDFKHFGEVSRVFGELPHFDNFDDAFKWVKRNAFMFDDISKDENMGRLLVPFWTWQRKSFFNTVRFISDHPTRFGSYLNLVNGIRNDFEDDEDAAWDALQMSGWMSKDSMIPFKIDKSYSASGEDEYYVYPVGQIFPIFELSDVLETFNPIKDSEPVHKNKANQFSVDRKGLKGFIINHGSPMVRGVLGLVDEDYLYDEEFDSTTTDELRDEYPFGLNKKNYTLLKYFGRPIYNVWKLLPESLIGRSPRLNPRTGKWDEGTPSAFTGERPNWSPYNQKAPFGRGTVITKMLDIIGKNPYHLDVLLVQDRTVGQIRGQVSELKGEIGKLRSRLSNTNFENKDQEERLVQAYEEMRITYTLLKSELEIYDRWRVENNLIPSDAVRKITKQNIKVDMMLTPEERESIYRKNLEMWYDGKF